MFSPRGHFIVSIFYSLISLSIFFFFQVEQHTFFLFLVIFTNYTSLSIVPASRNADWGKNHWLLVFFAFWSIFCQGFCLLYSRWYLFIIIKYKVTAILILRLSEAWHSKISLLVEAVKSLLEEQNLAVRKALSEVSPVLFF